MSLFHQLVFVYRSFDHNRVKTKILIIDKNPISQLVNSSANRSINPDK